MITCLLDSVIYGPESRLTEPSWKN